ncbi:hypothetical protein Tco_1114850 [Tanacetum coccineum]
MELESTNSGPTAKLPILKLGEYEMWVIRIKQYFQDPRTIHLEVIENGDYGSQYHKLFRRMVKKAVGGSSDDQNMGLLNAPSTNSSIESIHEMDLESKGFEVALSRLSVDGKEVGVESPRSKEVSSGSDKTPGSKETMKTILQGLMLDYRWCPKDLDQLLGSQITDKCKKGLGYSAVPPPHPLIYNRPNKLDLSYSGLDEFKEPEFKGYGPKDNGPKDSEQESNIVCG